MTSTITTWTLKTWQLAPQNVDPSIDPSHDPRLVDGQDAQAAGKAYTAHQAGFAVGQTCRLVTKSLVTI